MDDNEYYSLMRKQNFHRTDINIAKTKSDYRKWEINQGQEDAERPCHKFCVNGSG